MSAKLRYTPDPTFVLPVKLTVPGQDELAELTLIVKYKDAAALEQLLAARLSSDLVRDVIVSLKGSALISATPQIADFIAAFENGVGHRLDADIVKDLVTGWHVGPVDEAGVQVPYTPDAMANILRAYQAAPGEIVLQYLKHVYRSRLGN